MDKLVSVIIPTHGGGEFIQRVIDSVLNQTYKAVEILVVDDNGKGSVGQLETQSKLEKYKDYTNVKYIVHEANKNGSAARNTGICASKGEYLAFLDDDDEFNSQNIEKHVEMMERLSDEYGATYCDALKIRPGIKDEISAVNKSGDILLDFARDRVEIATSVIMIKRESMNYLEKWDESFRRHQDWEFVLRLLKRYKIQHVEYVGVVRHITQRHGAPNPDGYRDNRLHYLRKMQYIFDEFDSETQTAIYDSHYAEIGKEYFKKMKIRECIVWTNKTTHPWKNYISYFVAGYRYLKKKTGNKRG